MKHYIDVLGDRPTTGNENLGTALLFVLKVVYRMPITYVLCVCVALILFSYTPLNLIISLIFAPAAVTLICFMFFMVCYGIYWIGKSIGDWFLDHIFNLKAVNKVVDFLCIPLDKLVKLLEKWEIAQEEKQNAKHKADLVKLEKYLTCNNDPHSVTAEVDLIPLRDRTPTLIYTNIKNKVCKPLSR